MTTDHVHRNWTALAARMGYTSTRTQRARVVAATQRMGWSGYRAGDSRRPLAGPAVRAVAAAVLAGAAAERGDSRAADPMHNLIGIGIARLPGGHPLVGLDDGHIRQYVLDLGNEAISVLTEPSHEQASSMSPDEHGPGEPRPARPILRPRPHHSPGSEPPSYRSLRRVDQLGPRSALPASTSSAVLQVDDLALCDPDVLAAAIVRYEQRARQLIADGMPEDDALAHAADDALDYARRLVADQVRQQDRQAALDAVVDAYAGNTYRLLRDLDNALGASVAYVDRRTVEAHLERCLSDAEWAAAIGQFTAIDLDDAVGDQSDFRTDWIEAILERAGVPGHDYAADGVDNGAEPPGAA